MRLLIHVTAFFIGATVVMPQMAHAQKKGAQRLPFSYSYVRAFEYNLDNKLFGHHHPIKNGKLAPSIQGHGKLLTQDELAWLHKFLAEDLALIEVGLGKCYIPHHAFIFFDEAGKPVAYFSACLLCDGIDQSWVLKTDDPKYNKKTVARAENQMKRLGAFINQLGFPTNMNGETYPKYAEKKQFEQDKVNKDAVVMVPGDFWQQAFGKGDAQTVAGFFSSPPSIENRELASEDGMRTQIFIAQGANKIAWGTGETLMPRMIELTELGCKLLNGLCVGMTVEQFVALTGASSPFLATEVLLKDESIQFDFRITFYAGHVVRISGMRYG